MSFFDCIKLASQLVGIISACGVVFVLLAIMVLKVFTFNIILGIVVAVILLIFVIAGCLKIETL